MPTRNARRSLSIADMDPETQQLCQRAAEVVRNCNRKAAHAIWDAGRLLIAIKHRLGHGRFGKWVAAEFGMSDRTARMYMRIAEAFRDDINAVSTLSLAALYRLSAPNVPTSVRAEVIGDLKNGARITLRSITARLPPSPKAKRAATPVKYPVASSVSASASSCKATELAAMARELQRREAADMVVRRFAGRVSDLVALLEGCDLDAAALRDADARRLAARGHPAAATAAATSLAVGAAHH